MTNELFNESLICLRSADLIYLVSGKALCSVFIWSLESPQDVTCIMKNFVSGRTL